MIQANDLDMNDEDTDNSSYDISIQLEDKTPLKSENGTDKNKTELICQTNNIYYKGYYELTLKDSNNNVSIANKTVNFIINNINYTTTTDNNGIASVNLAFNPGTYTVIAYFMEDNLHKSSNMTSKVNILPTIKSQNISTYYKGSAQYSATFFDSQGNLLANKNVAISINGKTYTKRTDNKGIVNLAINLKPGTYKVVSTNPHNGYKLTTIFTILNTITASNMQKFIGDGKKFSAKFFKSNGQPLSKKYIKFHINGKTYKVKTNTKGTASLSLKKLKKGTYKILCYNTNDGLSKTYTIQIYKKPSSTKLTSEDYTFYQNESKEIKIKFTTSIKGSSIIGKLIKIKINKKTYTKKTDYNGIVYLKLPSLDNGVYTIECEYSGTKYFRPSKSTSYLTIIKTKNTELKVKSTKSFGYGANTELKVQASAGGVPLIKKTVIFNINGKQYTKTTNNNGIASIPINLKIGNYSINYTIPKDNKINGNSSFCDINVFKRQNPKLTWMSGTQFKDNSQTLKILLTDNEGNAISNQTIKLTINGETYSKTTSPKGYATIKSYAEIGKYKVSVKFNGNNLFTPTSKSQPINVKLSTYKNGVNEKHASAYLSAYLKSSSHCKVGSKKAKALVKKLTKGLTNKIDKAKAIFNYVRDTLKYSYYYNSKYGSSTTLKLKKGNCVDHSHLLIALYRTAGFKARYVHGTCTFSTQRTGHVWTQVLIDKTWVCGDAISYRNSLGKIKNWNTKTVSIRGKYASLPF